MNKLLLGLMSMPLVFMNIQPALASTLGILKLAGEVGTAVDHNGLVKISEAQIHQEVDVTGKLNAENTVFDKVVRCAGLTKMSHVTLNAASEFQGKVNLDGAIFFRDIFVKSDEGSSFDNTTVVGQFTFQGNEIHFNGKSRLRKLLVRRSAEHAETPRVYLSPEAFVEESITFDGLPGKVILQGNRIFTGIINNGQVVRE